MSTRKKGSGGSRAGAGRKKKPTKEKRVNLVARVHPDTKKRANKNRGKLSIGKYLDEIIP